MKVDISNKIRKANSQRKLRIYQIERYKNKTSDYVSPMHRLKNNKIENI